jgi:enoyl-CoA hydratase/carnithine racemase
MIIASPTATFGLPETSKGLYAGAGGLSRLVRLVGVTVASDVALAGRTLSGVEAGRYGIANRVAASAVDEAVAVAARVAGFSPDATVVSRWGLRRALETGSVERASQETDVRFGRALRESPNLEIGLRAFAERKTPKWVPSRL